MQERIESFENFSFFFKLLELGIFLGAFARDQSPLFIGRGGDKNKIELSLLGLK